MIPQVSQDNDEPVAIAPNRKITNENNAKLEQMLATYSYIASTQKKSKQQQTIHKASFLHIQMHLLVLQIRGHTVVVQTHVTSWSLAVMIF